METGADIAAPIELDQSATAAVQPTFNFSTEPTTFRFSAGSSFVPPPPSTIDFQPSGSQDTASSTQSKAEKARARTAKARETRARKIAERRTGSDNTDTDNTGGTRKTARITEIAEEANQERLESELSSELDEVNMRDLERQLDAHRNNQDFQPSSIPEITLPAPAEESRSRKRKQSHSEDLSLNIRSAGKRKTHSRKLSQNKRQ
jgi:hypothetical protein